MSLQFREKPEHSEQYKRPALMLAATNSGCGKTTYTCGLLEVLKRRGQKPAAFKCGPDYIDPLYYEELLDVPVRNLDTWFAGRELLSWVYAAGNQTSDIAIVEGVMGFYDGIAGTTLTASSWELADYLGIPVVLIVNGRGRSLSMLAEIKGFLEYQKESHIRAVLINGISAHFYPIIKKQIETELKIPVLGFLPELEGIAFASRYLGLQLPDSEPGGRTDIQRRIGRIADAMEQNVDIDQLLALAEEAAPLAVRRPPLPPAGSRVRLGIARDQAFCFYYKDNLELLERLGAELVAISPLTDEKLPDDIQGLILGGGYPEQYARQLSANQSMRTSVNERIQAGMPVLAECGGYLYLLEELQDPQGCCWPMAGVLAGRAWKEKRPGHFGYLELTLQEETVLGHPGDRIRGHEFHYYRSEPEGTAGRAVKPGSRRHWPVMSSYKNVLAGFPHLYYYSCPELLANFLERCREKGGKCEKKSGK